MLQQFYEKIGYACYDNPRRWKTPDGIIPFKLFALLWASLEPARALERLSMATAINLAFAGGEGDGPRLIAEAERAAYPENDDG